MERMVTPQDLIDNPELLKQGVSANQMFDFDEYEAQKPKLSVKKRSEGVTTKAKEQDKKDEAKEEKEAKPKDNKK